MRAAFLRGGMVLLCRGGLFTIVGLCAGFVNHNHRSRPLRRVLWRAFIYNGFKLCKANGAIGF